MRIVNTFISDSNNIPRYTEVSLKQARKINPDIQIDFICHSKQDYFDQLDINWINQKELHDDITLKTFNEVCDFKRHGTPNTTYPSPELFWHRTAERIFYLQAYMSNHQINDVFHFENDVIIYYPLEHADTSDKITVTNMSDTHTTFAISHIPSHSLLLNLCNFFNHALSYGERRLMLLGYDHISEMSLLNIAYRNNIVDTFPTTFNETGTFIYDPGSYGQYFGGTNNGHSSGFIDPTHHIGKLIMCHKLHPTIENERPRTEHNMIFNLHIHSKNLERFI